MRMMRTETVISNEPDQSTHGLSLTCQSSLQHWTKFVAELGMGERAQSTELTKNFTQKIEKQDEDLRELLDKQEDTL
jgi:hypothetical protein